MLLDDDEIPEAITTDLIKSTKDDELEGLLYVHCHLVLKQRGCYSLDGPRDREVLLELPRGIRLAWTMVALDWEVDNGGFYQWFTNSSGECADLTVEDLCLIGASSHVVLVENAIALDRTLEAKYPLYAGRWDRPEPPWDDAFKETYWADLEANFLPEYDRLSSDYYELEATDSLWPKFYAWVRQHPESCVHSR